MSNGNGNGHGHDQVAAAYAYVPSPATVTPITPAAMAPIANDGSQPILPPRPTGRSFTAQHPRSVWKSWPMLVIALAGIAIVVAVALMLMPPGSGSDAKRALQPPPAPERMETDPLPPPGQGNKNGADPWGGHSQVDPQPAIPRQTPDPIPPAAPAPADPFASLGLGGGLGGAQIGNPMIVAMVSHACDKLKACPGADDTFTTVCDTFGVFAQHAAPPTCPAAQRCMAAIDKLDCTADFSTSNPLVTMSSFSDCTTAITSC